MLRQDNADERLTPIGHKVGLISDERYQKLLDKLRAVDDEMERVSGINISPAVANPVLERYNSTPIKTGIKLCELIKRPELSYEKLEEIDTDRPELPDAVIEQAEIKLKYDGYIRRQFAEVEKAKKMEEKLLPPDTDYGKIQGLRLEARQKLDKIRPKSLGQASRISGVSPSDMSVLIVWLSSHKGR